MATLWIRAGDADDYHSFDSTDEAAEYLASMGAKAPLFRSRGLEGEGFLGRNYISAYWGIDAESPIQLTDEEIAEINAALRIEVLHAS